MQFTAREIADFVGGKLEGNPDTPVTGVAGLREALPGDLSFVASPKYFSAVKTTRASAVLLNHNAKVEASCVLIRVERADAAFAFAERPASERGAALAYATESMRLTTRLMQLASWLLLHRAVKEGEMSLAQANKEKTKVKLSAGEPGDPETIKLLPEKLRNLIEKSKKLNDQVRRLDANIYAPPLAPDQPKVSNPVERQMGLLKAAFEQDGH